MDFPMTRRRFITQGSKMALATGAGASILAACGGSTGGGGGSGPVTLTYGWWSNTPAKDNSMRSWINDFEKANPNIKIKPEILPWPNYWAKLKTTTAGGNAYDIIGMSSGMAASYFNVGALYDVSTFPDYTTAVSGLSPSALALSQWNGKTYSVPIGTSVSVLGYNKKLLDAAGVPIPDPVKPMAFSDFIAMGKKLSKKGVQYAINPTNILDFDTFVRMEGGQTYDHQVNPTKVTINSPEGIQGLSDYLSLFTEQIAPPYSELTNGPWSFDLGALDTGKIAFARVGPWLFSDMQKNPDYGITPLFTIKDPVVLGGANSLAIYKPSKNSAAAWEFLKWASKTPAEISFAKFSDIPADKQAFSELSTYLSPANFAPTMLAAFQTFQPGVVSAKDQLGTTLTDIITDMMAGKINPTQAAAKMEQQGNAVLASS